MNNFFEKSPSKENPAKNLEKRESFWGNAKKISHDIKNKINNITFPKAESPRISGKPYPTKYNPLRVSYIKSKNKIRKNSTNIANFGKSNFANPYPNAQLNTIDLFLGKWIERDFEKARAEGGLIIPKLLRASTIGSYIGKWLDTVLMPTGIPVLAWKTRQKLNDFFIPKISKTYNGIKSIYHQFEELTFSPEKVKKMRKNRQEKRSKFTENIKKPVGRLQNIINQEIPYTPEPTTPLRKRKRRRPNLKEKNKKFYERLKNAA